MVQSIFLAQPNATLPLQVWACISRFVNWRSIALLFRSGNLGYNHSFAIYKCTPISYCIFIGCSRYLHNQKYEHNWVFSDKYPYASDSVIFSGFSNLAISSIGVDSVSTKWLFVSLYPVGFPIYQWPFQLKVYKLAQHPQLFWGHYTCSEKNINLSKCMIYL